MEHTFKELLGNKLVDLGGGVPFSRFAEFKPSTINNKMVAAREVIGGQQINPQVLGTSFEERLDDGRLAPLGTDFTFQGNGGAYYKDQTLHIEYIPQICDADDMGECEDNCGDLVADVEIESAILKYQYDNCISSKTYSASVVNWQACETSFRPQDYLLRAINNIRDSFDVTLSKWIVNEMDAKADYINTTWTDWNDFIRIIDGTITINKIALCEQKMLAALLEVLEYYNITNPTIIDGGIFTQTKTLFEALRGGSDAESQSINLLNQLRHISALTQFGINAEKKALVYERGNIAVVNRTKHPRWHQVLGKYDNRFRGNLFSRNLPLTYDLHYTIDCEDGKTKHLVKGEMNPFLFVKPNECDDQACILKIGLGCWSYDLGCVDTEICKDVTVTMATPVQEGVQEITLLGGMFTTTEGNITGINYEVISNLNNYANPPIATGTFDNVLDETIQLNAGTYKVKFTVNVEVGSGEKVTTCVKTLEQIVCVNDCPDVV